MANLAALRATVFSLSAKNLRGGGGVEINPPPPVRGICVAISMYRVGQKKCDDFEVT